MLFNGGLTSLSGLFPSLFRLAPVICRKPGECRGIARRWLGWPATPPARLVNRLRGSPQPGIPVRAKRRDRLLSSPFTPPPALKDINYQADLAEAKKPFFMGHPEKSLRLFLDRRGTDPLGGCRRPVFGINAASWPSDLRGF